MQIPSHPPRRPRPRPWAAPCLSASCPQSRLMPMPSTRRRQLTPSSLAHSCLCARQRFDRIWKCFCAETACPQSRHETTASVTGWLADSRHVENGVDCISRGWSYGVARKHLPDGRLNAVVLGVFCVRPHNLTDTSILGSHGPPRLLSHTIVYAWIHLSLSHAPAERRFCPCCQPRAQAACHVLSDPAVPAL